MPLPSLISAGFKLVLMRLDREPFFPSWHFPIPIAFDLAKRN